MLERYGKGFDVREWTEVVRALASAGVKTYLYLLFGLPGETEPDRMATVDSISDLRGSVDFLNLSLFNLPRFCELADRAAEFGIDLLPSSSRHADERIALYSEFTEGERVPRREARLFLSRVASRQPEFRRVMVNTPRWFRAAHPAQMLLPGRRPLSGDGAASGTAP
jgi:radical SAM superfamily enzyme YgiQ (UPF0313 family)